MSTLVAMATSIDLWGRGVECVWGVGRMEIGFNGSLTAGILTDFLEMFLQYPSTKHNNFVQIPHFVLLL